jgi:hypothetical protein
MDLKELWPRRRTEYVDHDGELPPEWSAAVRPSGATHDRVSTDGIEVEEQAVGVGHATVVETHFRIRCDCGRRWWAIDLEPTTCPRCRRWVSIRSAV